MSSLAAVPAKNVCLFIGSTNYEWWDLWLGIGGILVMASFQLNNHILILRRKKKKFKFSELTAFLNK